MVMLVITVTLGLVLPQLSAMLFQSDLSAGLRRISGVFAHARSQAMVENEPWAVVLDLDAGELWASPAVDADPEEIMNVFDTTYDPYGEHEPVVQARRALKGMRLAGAYVGAEDLETDGVVVIRVIPRGLIEPSLIHLELQGEQDPVRTLRIKPFNGRVEIYEGALGFEDLEGEDAPLPIG
jgi:hypothetical protein